MLEGILYENEGFRIHNSVETSFLMVFLTVKSEQFLGDHALVLGYLGEADFISIEHINYFSSILLG